MNEAAAPEAGSAPPSAPRPTWTRYLKVGLPLVVVVAILLVWFWPTIQIKLAINGLHAVDPEARRAHLETLKSHEDRELVISELTRAVSDTDKAWDVRVQCAALLHRHFNRLGSLEKLLRSGSLDARGPVLTVLAPEPFFADQIAGNPDLRVRETVLEWMRRDGDLTRTHAIQIAKRLKQAEVLPLVRPLVDATNDDSRDARDLRIMAASALVDFGDCDQLPRLLPAARSDPNALVRLRFMQMLDNGAFRETPPAPCAGSVDEAAMREVVTAAVSDEDKAVRMGALLILGRRPAWAEPVNARIREILDGDGSGAERRHALETLTRSGGEAFLARLPAYFHDRAAEVRSTAARAVVELEGQDLEGCWIGLVEEETENQLVFTDALEYLFRFAKERVGFPPAMRAQASTNPAAFRQNVADLFAGKTIPVADTQGGKVDVSRGSVAEAWFRWWCGRVGVTGDDVEKAVAARKAFQDAKARGDAGAARAALDGLDFSVPQGLFAYERGWLATK